MLNSANSQSHQPEQPGNQPQEEVFDPLSHFLIADLVTQLPSLPGEKSCEVIRLIPPRETLSDPTHLEAFFVTLASLIARQGGSGQLVGGRMDNGSLSRQHSHEKTARRTFLAGLEVAGKDEATRGFQVDSTLCDDPRIQARRKGVAKHYREEWQHVVSFEIVGRYQEVSFLVRLADPTMRLSIVALLRQEYPHLGIETPNTNPPETTGARRSLTYTGTETETVTNKGNTGRKPVEKDYDFHRVHNQRGTDPLVHADSIPGGLRAYRWLLLGEHPTLPLAPGGSSHRSRSGSLGHGETESDSGLRRLLATLAGLGPGETACSQLMVFGPVEREWVSYQQAQALRLQALQAASYKSATLRGPVGGRSSSSNSALSGRPSHSSTPPPADNRGLLTITAGAIMVCVGFFWWLEWQEVLAEGDTLQIVSWLGLRVGAAAIGLLVLTALWWMLRSSGNGSRLKSEPFEAGATLEKLSSPPLLAALRQVVWVDSEPYLWRACHDGLFKTHFEARGYHQSEATRLYVLRQQWRRHAPGPSDNPATIAGSFGLKGFNRRLVEVDDPENEVVWELVRDLADALAQARVDELQESLAAAYSPFGNPTGKAFVTMPGEELPLQRFSSLSPYDWSGPSRLRHPGLASHWPFNTFLFDWLADLFDPTLPPAAKEHRGLLVLNALELSHLWHLPGGYETLYFVERTGPKKVSPPSHLVNHFEGQSQANRGKAGSDGGYRIHNSGSSSTSSPLFGLETDDEND